MNPGKHIFVITIAAAVTGCATPNLNPFGKPYSSENMMPTGPQRGCRLLRGDSPPELLFGSKPIYPVGSNLSGVTGNSQITYVVKTDGTVRVVETSHEGSPYMASHGEVAMSDWRFKPAMRSGQAVEVTCIVRFEYELL